VTAETVPEADRAPDDASALMPDLINQTTGPRGAWTRMVLEVVTNAAEPLSVQEIVAGMPLPMDDKPHDSTVRTIVRDLVQTGLIHGRVETKEERFLRSGGKPRATAGTLYSARNPVPERTTREVVPGYVLDMSRAPRGSKSKRMPQADRINAVMETMLQYSPDKVWRAKELSASSGVREKDVKRRVLDPMVKQGLIVSVPLAAGNFGFRLVTADDTPTQARPMPTGSARTQATKNPAAQSVLDAIKGVDTEIARLQKARVQLQNAFDALK
jgi:hypothetical protein